ncbi:MAG: orotidine-5'-phosphate decarboxylase [Mycoplasmataceae bacterium]|nr:orotidine-5'-phosphate decarboxylase [Mycoplasmataceae bacterium]
MKRDVIIACDFASENEFNKFIKLFKNEKPFLKIGYQLFYATGKKFISDLVDKGYRIFLDLKLHDIPNTVEQGIKSLVSFGVEFITIHATGGTKMMEAAIKATKGTTTKLLAVTQLTSTNQEMLENELLIDRKLSDVVNHYAVNALESGIHGVVCSALESKYIKEKISNNLITVSPGIRISQEKNDQSRVCTPRGAHTYKVDYIVVGRPITQSKDPLKEYKKFCKEFIGE